MSIATPSRQKGIDCTDLCGKVKRLDLQQSTALCLVCNDRPDRAISFAGYTLCDDCERRIVNSQPGDSDYDHIVVQLREFWRGLAEAAASRE